MAIQPETIAGLKEHFRKKRAEFVSTWTTDEHGIVHIPLGDGIDALISGGKKAIASDFIWRLKPDKRGKPYVYAHVIEELRSKYGRYTSLHRVVLGVESEIEVDHEDGDGLNCVDSNLRPATSSQNSSNRHYINSTGYRGVCKRNSKKNPYAAQIEYDGKNHYLGVFKTAAEAALRYNAEAIKVFGEFAILNRFKEAA